MKRRCLFAAAILTFFFARIAHAQDSAAVPAWSPSTDRKQTWKIEQLKERSRSSLPQRWEEARGALVQHMTVLGRTLTGFSVGWDFDPPDESIDSNRFQKAVMAIYGVDKLSIGVDPGGRPLIAYGAAGRDQQVESYAAGLPRELEGEARLLAQFRAQAADDPMFEVQLFAKPAIMIGRLQRAESWIAQKGETFRLQQTDHIYDAPVTGEATFKVEDIDTTARRVTLSWVWEISTESLPSTMRRQIATMLEGAAGQAAVLPLPLRGDVGTSSFVYQGQAQLSLDDGSLLSAREERVLRIGFETEYLTLRLTREQ